MKPPRLTWPLAISVALHLGITGLLSAGSPGYLARTTKAVTLTVLLAHKERTEPLPISTAERPATAPAEVAPASATAATGATGTITQKAHFLLPPDLSALEQISVPVSGSFTLRLEVSALGTVDRVAVVKSDPVPKALLDGAVERFRQARLAPAREGSKAVPSTLDLVIRYEAAPVPEWREPVPGAPTGITAPARPDAKSTGEKRDGP